MADELDWNVAIYCLNEERRLQGCLDRVIAALTGRRALITVILNGSRDRSADIARNAAMAGGPIEIFQIAAADKSNAINQFIYKLRSPSHNYGAVDGYAYIAATSFRAMEEKLETDPHAMTVSGICTNGRTMKLAAERMLKVGGLHGQLHAFRRDFLDRMVARGIRLPLGTYCGDGLLGSMAAHNLDAIHQPWDNGRIVGVAAATYEIPELSLFRIDDIGRHLRRKVRQMRGRIQNAAIKDLIYQVGYEGLPADADQMVEDYLAVHDPPRVGWADWPFQILAIRQDRRVPKRDYTLLVPHRVNA